MTGAAASSSLESEAHSGPSRAASFFSMSRAFASIFLEVGMVLVVDAAAAAVALGSAAAAFAALQLSDGVLCGFVRSRGARSRLHSWLHCSAVRETLLHCLGLDWDVKHAAAVVSPGG